MSAISPCTSSRRKYGSRPWAVTRIGSAGCSASSHLRSSADPRWLDCRGPSGNNCRAQTRQRGRNSGLADGWARRWIGSGTLRCRHGSIGLADSWEPEVLLAARRGLASFPTTLTNHSDPRVWLITGASSGFGRAIAEAVVARGDSVAGGARTAQAFGSLPDGVHPLTLDVTVADQRVAA